MQLPDVPVNPTSDPQWLAGYGKALADAAWLNGLVPGEASVDPIGGPVAGGTVVEIIGTNFFGVTAVMFGATPATAFTVLSQTQIAATAPAGAAGEVNVTVVAAGGISPATVQYTFVAPPPPPPVPPAWTVVKPTDNLQAILASLTPGQPNRLQFVAGQSYTLPCPMPSSAAYSLDMQNCPTTFVPAVGSTSGFVINQSGTQIFGVNAVATPANTATVLFLVQANCFIHTGKTTGAFGSVVKVTSGSTNSTWQDFTCDVVNDYAGFFGGSIGVYRVKAMGSYGQATFRTTTYAAGDPLPANVIVEGCELFASGKNAKGVFEWRSFGLGCKCSGNIFHDYVRVGQLSATSATEYGLGLSYTGNTHTFVNPTVPQNLMICAGVTIGVTANNFLVGNNYAVSLSGPTAATFSNNNVHLTAASTAPMTTLYHQATPPTPAGSIVPEVGTVIVAFTANAGTAAAAASTSTPAGAAATTLKMPA